MKEKKIKKFFIIPILILYFLLLYKSKGIIQISIGIFVRRFELITIFIVFLLMHCLIDISKLYNFLFKFRFYICIVMLIFSVSNNFNGSSIGMWNQIIQPDYSPEYGNAILGTPQAIRSDEWDVNIPRMMSGTYNDFSKYNYIVRGEKTDNISASNLYRDYSMLYNPSLWGYYLFDFSHGLSFRWSYLLIFGFLFSFEFMYILTQKKSVSVLGGAILWFSPFNAWWSLALPLLSLVAIPTLFYYTITSSGVIKRAVFAFMLAIAGADFCCNLYPAWQVPAGWIIISIIAFVLIEYRDWKKYKLYDWGIIIAAIVFMISIIVRFVVVDMSYIKGVSSTLYPGARVDFGGNSIYKLYHFVSSFLSGVTGVGLAPNNCEAATFFGAFPLGYILIPFFYYLAIKKRALLPGVGRKKTLLNCLLFPLIILTLYCSVSLPPFMAKILLMDKSTNDRAVDFLGALLVIITIVIISEIKENGGIGVILAVVISGISGIFAYTGSIRIFPDNRYHLVEIVTIIFVVTMIVILTEKNDKRWNYVIISFAIFASIGGLSVNPIMISTDAIAKKPAADEIQRIVKDNKKAKWVSTNSTLSQYLIANGAPTITSINYIPNMKLWKKLDPDGKHKKVYDRYAHFAFALSEDDKTKIELYAPDVLSLSVSKEDFDKLGADYLAANEPISENWSDEFELIYQESNVYIYHRY